MNRTRWMLVLAGLWLAMMDTGCGSDDKQELNLEEFQLNTTPNRGSAGVDVQLGASMAASGRFLGIFGVRVDDGVQTTLFGQFFDSDGNKVGGEVRITGSGDNIYPSVAVGADGKAWVVWTGPGGILSRRYDANGQAMSDPVVLVPDARAGSISMGGNDQIVVVYQKIYQSGQDNVFAQRFNSSGAPVGSELSVKVDGGNNQQSFPQVFVDSSGQFVVVWGDNSALALDPGVHAQRFAADGTRLGDEVLVRRFETAAFDRGGPFALAGKSSGDFVVGWSERTANPHAIETNAFIQRYSATGSKVGEPVQVNSTMNQGGMGSVAMRPDGSIAVVWRRQVSDKGEVVLQRMSASGSREGIEEVVSHPPSSDEEGAGNPAIAAGLDSRLVVLWAQGGWNEPDYTEQVYSYRGRLFED